MKQVPFVVAILLLVILSIRIMWHKPKDPAFGKIYVELDAEIRKITSGKYQIQSDDALPLLKSLVKSVAQKHNQYTSENLGFEEIPGYCVLDHSPYATPHEFKESVCVDVSGDKISLVHSIANEDFFGWDEEVLQEASYTPRLMK